MTEESVEMIRQVITDNPRTEITHLSQQVKLPYTTCKRILKDDLEFHPYRQQVKLPYTTCKRILKDDLEFHPYRLNWSEGRWEQKEDCWTYFLNGTLNAERYRLEILTPCVQMLHDGKLQEGYIQQDGARPHITMEMITYIDEFFEDFIISLCRQYAD
ncbi:hypothetical protein NQ318_007384 [Aromia moschata]|uniref:Transposase n=1 Tax=Aromia moschata TaxID=1265417 RepID=A0AAV8YFG8_9CUCU|nr:hypothetical protein NQ318_007384 [Aromia moschata]